MNRDILHEQKQKVAHFLYLLCGIVIFPLTILTSCHNIDSGVYESDDFFDFETEDTLLYLKARLITGGPYYSFSWSNVEAKYYFDIDHQIKNRKPVPWEEDSIITVNHVLPAFDSINNKPVSVYYSSDFFHVDSLYLIAIKEYYLNSTGFETSNDSSKCVGSIFPANIEKLNKRHFYLIKVMALSD